ncbi:MAG: molybdopterin molybdotransferase MoeA [Eubacteriales bacterium]|nr:molybdopterin molybdotransferase MoeA [Eubacteriales bacterium]
MELLKVDSLEVAKEKLYNEYKKGLGIEIEEVLVSDSFNRVIANNVISKVNVPDFNRSTVDGYAVLAKDTNGSSDTIPTFLKVVAESKMGEECKTKIVSGECVYVPTGGMLPIGANAMVMLEHTENLTNEKIAIYEATPEWKNVVHIGDDIKEEETVIKKGKKISAGDMGLLSSIGVESINVYKKWRITIISTGDELVSNEKDYKFGKIRDVNSNLLLGLCIENNFEIVNKFLIKDDENDLREIINDCKKNSDVVVISGGSSKGKKDLSAKVIYELSSTGVLTHGIAIKPGKPTITAYDKKTNTVLIGLPGHPIAAFLLFKLLIVDLYEKITCEKNKSLQKYLELCISENLPASPGRTTFQLVSIENDKAIPIYGRSGLIHTLSMAMGYIIMEENQEGINKGERVKVYYL